MTDDREAQAQIIGRYEDNAGIPFGPRITWPYYALGYYISKPGVHPEQIQDRLEAMKAKQTEQKGETK